LQISFPTLFWQSTSKEFFIAKIVRNILNKILTGTKNLMVEDEEGDEVLTATEINLKGALPPFPAHQAGHRQSSG
jgi:hypothetical protein